MRVAICDDEKICRAQVLDIATDYSEERRDKDVEFFMFEYSEALFKDTLEKGSYDIYILDIVMPGMNGIELGKALRNEGVESKIIYLTSSEEYALESFRVRAFDYILKPIKKQDFYTVMDEAISSIHIKKDKGIIVKTKEHSARITFDSILYAELKGRAIIYHLVDGKTVESTTIRTNFTEAVSGLLGDKRFTPCGASMVANMHHITKVENEGFVFKDNHRVFLGKKACRELRTAWNVYWITEGEGK